MQNAGYSHILLWTDGTDFESNVPFLCPFNHMWNSDVGLKHLIVLYCVRVSLAEGFSSLCMNCTPVFWWRTAAGSGVCDRQLSEDYERVKTFIRDLLLLLLNVGHVFQLLQIETLLSVLHSKLCAGQSVAFTSTVKDNKKMKYTSTLRHYHPEDILFIHWPKL